MVFEDQVVRSLVVGASLVEDTMRKSQADLPKDPASESIRARVLKTQLEPSQILHGFAEALTRLKKGGWCCD